MFCRCRGGRRRACVGAVIFSQVSLRFMGLGALRHTFEACSVRWRTVVV